VVCPFERNNENDIIMYDTEYSYIVQKGNNLVPILSYTFLKEFFVNNNNYLEEAEKPFQQAERHFNNLCLRMETK